MNIPSEVKKTFEIISLYKEKNLTKSLAEYHVLFDALIFLNEAVAESNIKFPDWWTYSDTLMTKFILHSNTFYDIATGSSIKSKYFKEFSDNRFLDIPSLKIVLRAQLEAFLMYHYIFVNPLKDDEKKFRFNIWIYTSLLERQSIAGDSAYAIQQKQKDVLAIKSLENQITASPYFKSLTVSQQNTLIRKGSARLFQSWKLLLAETGFENSSIMSDFYSIMSNYAHFEGLSIMQIKESNFGYDDSNEQANFSVFLSKQIICLNILSIVKIYEVVKVRFDKMSDDIKDSVKIYSMIAKSAKRQP